jgi:hypothetical protein
MLAGTSLTRSSIPEDLMTREIQNQPPRPKPANQAPGDPAQGDQVQGEGNYEAARRYREGVNEFLSHADVEGIAHKAAPNSALEARELALAAEKGQLRSKGDDPADVGAMYPGGDDSKP